MTVDREFARLESHLLGSWLLRSASALAAACAVSADRSAAAGTLRRIAAPWNAAPGSRRLRAVGVCVVVATLGHVLLLRFIPAHIAPALPRPFWLLVAATASIVAALADRVTAAWEASAVAGLWRTITGWVFPESRISARRQAL